MSKTVDFRATRLSEGHYVVRAVQEDVFDVVVRVFKGKSAMNDAVRCARNLNTALWN